MYLITYSGERHEDHIPLVLLTTMTDVRSWVNQHAREINAKAVVNDKYVDFIKNGDVEEQMTILEVHVGIDIQRT
jgi:hypothetical protein